MVENEPMRMKPRLDVISKPDMDTSNEPYSILLEKVKKGELGAKTGKGFYEWTPEFTEAWREKIIKALVHFQKSEKD